MPGLRKSPLWVVDESTGCWNWARAFVRKHPVFTTTGFNASARRHIWKQLGRPLDDKLYIDAGCGNHKCVNPDHYRIPNGGDLWSVDAESGCWRWTGSKVSGGYGRLTIDGQNLFAHRRIWELIHGPLGEFESISCRCRQRDCVNPDHHYLVSPGISVTSEGCWEWTGVRNENNYGHTCFGNVKESAHRRMYRLWYGSIAEGMDVLHRCDNPPCCNPEHLFLGTAKDNAMDMVAKDRCGPAKLSNKYAAELREMRRTTGIAYAKLARLYGISKPAAMLICKGESFPDYTPPPVPECQHTMLTG